MKKTVYVGIYNDGPYHPNYFEELVRTIFEGAELVYEKNATRGQDRPFEVVRVFHIDSPPVVLVYEYNGGSLSDNFTRIDVTLSGTEQNVGEIEKIISGEAQRAHNLRQVSILERKMKKYQEELTHLQKSV